MFENIIIISARHVSCLATASSLRRAVDLERYKSLNFEIKLLVIVHSFRNTSLDINYPVRQTAGPRFVKLYLTHN